MLERFRAHLEQSGLIPEGLKVLVGYSGGADSTCLLHLLHLLGVDVVGAHLHHGQRGEAEEELSRCQAFCDELNVPFVSGRAQVPQLAKDLSVGLEEAGRVARYQFFDSALHQTGCDLIATAHTRSDHVETVLLNIARGSGMSGLAGIPNRRDRIVRPLLAFSRQETQQYCKEHRLWFHEDPANSDLTFSRARVRHRIKPEFESINPRFEEVVSRLSEIVSIEDQFLNGAAAAGLERAEVRVNGNLHFLSNDVEIALDAELLKALPEVLLRRALRIAVRTLGAEMHYDHVESVLEALKASQKGSVTCEGGRVVLEWDREILHIRDLTPDTPYRYPLTVPGETISDSFGWQFVAYETDHKPGTPQRDALETQLSLGSIKGSLFFRTVQPGDRLQPTGFSGHRKLSDLLSERKLTQAARARLPIVCDLIGPLWVPGVCLDQRAQPAPGDARALRLIFGPIEADSGHNGGNSAKP